jgi:uncharacterized membrane protein YfhO
MDGQGTSVLVSRAATVASGFACARLVCCAFVVGNNFYGATALAIFFGVLVLAVYIRIETLGFRASAAIGALSYGLSAFWLVPSYLEITIANMRFVSTQGTSGRSG